jgi:elongation factor 1-beta
MGKVLITLKVMPESPDVDLEELKKIIISKIESEQGKNIRFEEQSIAFGLKALMTFFMLDESQELEPIENKIQDLPEVSSTQVTDMRRAVG